MAARLKIGKNKSGTIFRGLYGSDNGTFEKDVMKGINEWLLRGPWDRLNSENLLSFKKKVKRIAKKCWPYNVPKNGMFSWIYHNHRFFSGNVPAWADWQWPSIHNVEVGMFEMHFYYLLVGRHPAGGNYAVCLRKGSIGNNQGSIYRHTSYCVMSTHTIEISSVGGRGIFTEKVRLMKLTVSHYKF